MQSTQGDLQEANHRWPMQRLGSGTKSFITWPQHEIIL